MGSPLPLDFGAKSARFAPPPPIDASIAKAAAEKRHKFGE
jgi:hypothetical protein